MKKEKIDWLKKKIQNMKTGEILAEVEEKLKTLKSSKKKN